MSTSKHFDKICAAVVALSLIITILFMNGEAFGLTAQSRAPGYETRLFDTTAVHTIDIVMDDWDDFIETCENEEYAPATLVIDGEKYGNVGIRAKGNTSLSNVSSLGSQRYSLKIEFDHYETGKSYYGLDKLCLNNMIQDNTMMKDYLVYRMMDEFGVESPLCSYTYITVNGEDWGLFLAVEGIEDAFMSRTYGSDTGEIYKPDSMSFGGGRGNGKGFNMDDFDFGDLDPEDFDPETFDGKGFDPEGFDPNSFDAESAASRTQNKTDASDTTDISQSETDATGTASTMTNGNMPQLPGNGEMPQLPDNGEMPQLPDNGEMPQLPDNGEMPQLPDNGEMPQLPDNGEMPQPSNDDIDNMPGDMGGGKGNFGGMGGGKGNFGDMGGGKGNFGGMGGGKGMGSSDDVKLKYIDDDPDSYANIFDNAKTDITDADKQRLIASLKNLSDYTDLENTLNMEEVLRYFVVHNFVCNGDSYTGSMIHNYYLHEKDGQLSMIPWDYNLAYGTFQGNQASSTVNTSIDSPVSGGNMDDRPMVGWIFSDESYTNAYHALFSEFITRYFTDGELAGMIQDTADLIRPYVEKDPTKFCTTEEFEKGITALTSFVTLRGEAVNRQLAGDTTTVDTGDLNLSDMGTMGGGMGGGKGQPSSMPGNMPEGMPEGMPGNMPEGIQPPDGNSNST